MSKTPIHTRTTIALAIAVIGILLATSPAFADGRIYLRLADGVVCYDLRAKGRR